MDRSLSVKLDRAADCLVTAFFYFELSALPVRRDGQYIQVGTCSARSDVATDGSELYTRC